MSNAQRFATIFDGLQSAFGTYEVQKQQSNGKNTGKASVKKEPRKASDWEGHLSGTGASMGIIPINEDNNCVWGCVDVDQYPLDHAALVAKIRHLKLPLVVCRSKSGGAHCFLFSNDWIPAENMQTTLKHVSAVLGYGGSEIFPKQIKLNLERGDVGNFLNMPYYDSENGLRYAILDDGTAATLEEFFELHAKYVQTPEQIHALQLADKIIATDEVLSNAPPCIQHCASQGFPEGTRNNGLFGIGVLLRKAVPETWDTALQEWNIKYMDPPLPLTEVATVAKQVSRKDYGYRCNDAPYNAYCNKELCYTKKHGVGNAQSGAAIANLRKYNSNPPVWFLDVNGIPLELDTEALLNQADFKKACLNQLNFMPQTQEKRSWESRINHLLSEMNNTEGAIIEVSQDASVDGQFYDYLEEFCTNMQQAQDREEILLRRPYTDEDEQVTYFRLKDFESYLKKNKFFEYKSHKVAQRLRDRNGISKLLKIKGKPVRVWALPAFESMQGDIKTPDFGGRNEEAPF
jgi:hypothetical protein